MSKYLEVIEECINNSQEQLTLKEIVDQTGVSKTTVHRIIKQLGYECRKIDPWNKGLTKETNTSLVSMSKKLEQRTGWRHSEETKKKISSSMKGKGGIREASGRGTVWDYGDEVLNSDYELKVAELLDEENISWNNNNIFHYNEKGITRMISLGFYLKDYDIYMTVRYHINNDTRRRIGLASKQNDVKVIIVDELLYRRIMFNSIENILKTVYKFK